MSLYWPIALIVISNVTYHTCAKSTPEAINPFAALTVTYVVAAISSIICYFSFNSGGNLAGEYSHLNWTPFILGLAIVGLEAGSIYMYKAGWNINTGYLLQSVIVSMALLIIGFLVYKEAITWTKATGILICMVGIYFINK